MNEAKPLGARSSSCSPSLDRGLSGGDGHLQLGDVAGRVVAVPLVVELAAAPSEPVAAVIDPANEALVDRLDSVHWPPVNNGCNLDDRQLDDTHVVAVRDALRADAEAGVHDDAAVV